MFSVVGNKIHKPPKIKVILTGALLTLSILTPTLLTQPAHAADGGNGYYIPSGFLSGDSSSNIIDNGSSRSYNADQNGLNNTIPHGTKSVGFDIIYGNTRGDLRYLGEISPYQKENKDGYRQSPTKKIGDIWRGWGFTDDEKKIPTNADGINKKDLHWSSMMKNSGSMTQGLGVAFITTIYGWANSIMNFLFEASGFDVSTLTRTFNDSGVPGMLAKVFLYNNDGISPLFMLAVLGFMLNLISMGFRFAKGRASIKSIFGELGWMMLAMVFVGAAMNTTSLNNLSSAGQALGNTLANKVMMSTSSNLAIFETDNGNSNRSSIITQKSILRSGYVDAWIQRETGYSVSELDMNDFGDAKKIRSIERKIGYKDQDHQYPYFNDGDAFKINLGKGTTNNLGYFIYAAFSNVDIKNNDGKPWAFEGQNVRLKTTTKDFYRELLAIDFLNEVYKSKDTSDAAKNKAATIIENLNNPNHNDGSFMVQLGLLTLLDIVIFITMFNIVIMMLVGKMIITIGVFVIVVFPILLMMKGTRNLAKQMMNTYVVGFLKFAVASAMFNSLIALAVILSSQGITGTLLAIIVLIALGKFSKKLVNQIDAQLNQIGRSMGGTLPINNILNDRIEQAKQRFNRQQRIDPNTGMMVNRNEISRTNNVLNGIKRGKSVKDIAKSAVFKYGSEQSTFKQNEDEILFDDSASNVEYKFDDQNGKSVLFDNNGNEIIKKSSTDNMRSKVNNLDNRGDNFNQNKIIKDSNGDIIPVILKDSSLQENVSNQENARKVKVDHSKIEALKENSKKLNSTSGIYSDNGIRRASQLYKKNIKVNRQNGIDFARLHSITQSLGKNIADKGPLRKHKLQNAARMIGNTGLIAMGVAVPGVGHLADSLIQRQNLNLSQKRQNVRQMRNIAESLSSKGSVTIGDVAKENARREMNALKPVLGQSNKYFDEQGNAKEEAYNKKFEQLRKRSVVEFTSIGEKGIESVKRAFTPQEDKDGNIKKIRVNKGNLNDSIVDEVPKTDKIVQNVEKQTQKKQNSDPNNFESLFSTMSQEQYSPIDTKSVEQQNLQAKEKDIPSQKPKINGSQESKVNQKQVEQVRQHMNQVEQVKKQEKPVLNDNPKPTNERKSNYQEVSNNPKQENNLPEKKEPQTEDQKPKINQPKQELLKEADVPKIVNSNDDTQSKKLQPKKTQNVKSTEPQIEPQKPVRDKAKELINQKQKIGQDVKETKHNNAPKHKEPTQKVTKHDVSKKHPAPSQRSNDLRNKIKRLNNKKK